MVNVTTDQLQKGTKIAISSHPSATIDGETIRWPTFGLNNKDFEGISPDQTRADHKPSFHHCPSRGHQYSLTDTCNIDAGLFAIFFLYRTDTGFENEVNDGNRVSPYQTLLKTFQLVEEKGWDYARIFWLLKNNRLNVSNRKMKSMFGSVDANVFCFLKSQQRYYTKIVCTRPECKERERTVTTTELNIR